MSHLFLVRHGQSEWNAENRFTGWVDVDLAPQGKLEAVKSGELIKLTKINLDFFYTSFQKRAIETLKLILNTLRIKDEKVIKAWQLNERHYGVLTGLNKIEMIKKLGEKKVHQFRRSWDIKPEPLDKKSEFHPLNIKTYEAVSTENIPDSESLKDTFKRVTDYYQTEIKNYLKDENVLISAHGNSIRALLKYLLKLDEIQISTLEIPTGNPLLIEIDERQKINNCKYLDVDRAKDLVIF